MTTRFDLQLSRSRDPQKPFGFYYQKQPYVVRWGEYEERRAVFPWDERLEADLAALGSLEADGAVLAGLSQKLLDFLRSAGWWDSHQEALHACRTRHTRAELVIRSRAAELYTLPWELLELDSGKNIGSLPKLLVRYEWPGESDDRARPAPSSVEGGRTLFAWSSAGGLVPAVKHGRALRAALSEAPPAIRDGLVEIQEVRPDSLIQALEDARAAGEEVSSLHILCHGTAVEKAHTRHFALAWQDEFEDLAPVDGPALRRLLEPYRDMIRCVVLCACHGGGRAQSESPVGSIAQELHRSGIEAVIASRLPLSVPGSTLLSETLYRSLLAGGKSLEDAVLDVRSALFDVCNRSPAAGGLDWMSLQFLAHAPATPDLRPYTLQPWLPTGPLDRAHRHFLVGRGPVLPPSGDASEWEARARGSTLASLVRRLRSVVDQPSTERLQTLVGANGVGKSSLLQAGLIPVLEAAEPSWRVFVAEPHHDDDPRGPFASWLLETGEGPVPRDLAEPEAEARLRAHLGTLEGPVLLVLDQAEELLTHRSVDERQHTFGAMARLAQDPELRIACLGVIREASRAGLSETLLDDSDDTDLIEQILHAPEHVHTLEPLPPGRLADVVSRVSERAGLRAGPRLVHTAVEDLAGLENRLPLLTYTLQQLWRRRSPEGELELATFHELGGTEGALAARAEEVLHLGLMEEEDPIPPGRLAAARSLFLTLAGARSDAEGSARVPLEGLLARHEEAAERDCIVELVDRLVDAGVVIDGEMADPTGSRLRFVALGDPALLTSWPRLQLWRAEDAPISAQVAELVDAATRWTGQGRTEDLLARGRALVRYRFTAEEHPLRITEGAVAFVRASDALDERVRQQEAAEAALKIRRTKQFATVVTALMVLAVVAALWALWSRIQAKDANLVAAAEAYGETDPTLTLQLLKEVTRPGDHPRWAALATEALVHPHSSAVHGPLGGELTDLAFSEEGDWFVASDASGMVHVLPLSGVGPTHRMWPEGLDSSEDWWPVVDVAVSRDGRTLAALWELPAPDVGVAQEPQQPGRVCVGPTSLEPPFTQALTRCAEVDLEQGALVGIANDGSEVVVVVHTEAEGDRLHRWTVGESLGYHPEQALWADGTTKALVGVEQALVEVGDHIELRNPLDHDRASPRSFVLRRSMEATDPANCGSVAAATKQGRFDLAPSLDLRHLALLHPAHGARLMDAGVPEADWCTAGVGSARSVALTPDTLRMAIGSEDTKIRLFQGDHPDTPTVFSGHTSTVSLLAFTPDGNHLVSGSEDLTVRVWPVPELEGDRDLDVPRGTSSDFTLAARPEGWVIPVQLDELGIAAFNQMDSADAEGICQAIVGGGAQEEGSAPAPDPSAAKDTVSQQAFLLWWENADGPMGCSPLEAEMGSVNAMSVHSEEGESVAAFVGQGAGGIAAVTLESKDPSYLPRAYLHKTRGSNDAATSEELGEGSAGHRLGLGSIWGVDSCQPPSGPVRVAAATDDGGLLMATWSLTEGWGRDPVLVSPTSAIWALSFKDPRHCDSVLTVDNRGRLLEWTYDPDAGTLTEGANLSTREDPVPSFGLAVNHNGTCAVQGFVDGSLETVWIGAGAQSPGYCDAELSPQSSAVWNLSFDRTGKRVLSSSIDGSLLVQGVHSSQPQGLIRLEGHGDAVWDGIFVKGGKKALSVGADGSLRLWNLQNRLDHTGSLKERVEGATSACMAPARLQIILRMSAVDARAEYHACRQANVAQDLLGAD